MGFESSSTSSLEAMKMLKEGDFLGGLYHSAVAFEPQLEVALREGKPDLIVLDHFLVSPAIAQASAPFVNLFSGNPLMLFNNELLPPPCSGENDSF